MNISYKWLKDYIDFDLDPEKLGQVLTSVGLECGGIEEIESIKGGLKGLVIGKVLTCIEHPNSDHLHITTVDVGQTEPLKIVCGAPNIAAGQTVVVALIGAVLYDGDNSFTIKKSKIRGEESFGMICSEVEIGVGTASDGIISIQEEVKPGTPAAEYFHVESDYVLEIDLTPNRVDASSHLGVARDLGAYLNRHGIETSVRIPSLEKFIIDKETGGVEVEVIDQEGAPRYSGITISGIQVKESPEWLKNRLITVGLRPINCIVDITNYVMLELGHPLHAFDVAKIAGRKVVVRNAKEGSKFTTLDEIERTLTENDLMICDAEKPMCIAGVFGGLNSGVTENTTEIFIEAAAFHPTRVRKTARRFGLNTDASFRFERGIDPNQTLLALKRAAILVKELAGGTIVGPIQDIYSHVTEPFEVELSLSKTKRLIGIEIPKESILTILKALDMEVVKDEGDKLLLHVPVYRFDVRRDVDVIEDILRIYGYNEVDVDHQLKSNLSYETPTDRSYRRQELISEQLTGLGFKEIMNNSLTSESYYLQNKLYPVEHCVHLINPLSNDLNVMRQTLIFGGLNSIAYNEHHKQSSMCFYEIGNCYFFNESKNNPEKPLSRFSEQRNLALWVSGKKVQNSWAHPDQEYTFYDLKAYVENILMRIGVNKNMWKYKEISNNIFATGLSIELNNGKEIGTLGIIAKPWLKTFDIEQPVFAAELNWEELMRIDLKQDVLANDISKFPVVKRDLALLVDKNIRFSTIEDISLKSERKLLSAIQLFDVYEGKNLPEGKKSYAVSFYLQDQEKTLTDKQIDAIMQKIRTNLEKQINAELR